MHKIPRDISGRKLAQLLKRYDYKIKKQTGSHITLVTNFKNKKHKITIPDHQFIKIGTLNRILNDLKDYLKITKEKLIKELL